MNKRAFADQPFPRAHKGMEAVIQKDLHALNTDCGYGHDLIAIAAQAGEFRIKDGELIGFNVAVRVKSWKRTSLSRMLGCLVAERRLHTCHQDNSMSLRFLRALWPYGFACD